MNLRIGILLTGLLATTVAAQTDPTTAPAGAKVLLALTGVGVQIYACKDQGTGPAWIFVAPKAKLLDRGTEAGTHGAGPTWTLKDGSWIKGKLIATKPSPDADAIPWLLLATAETKGPGLFAEVRYIRRSDTAGGKAPTTGCDATNLGATHEVPYTAIYTFYSAPQ